MLNDRPIEDPRLQAVLDAILSLAREQDLGCAVMLVSEEESAFGYQLYTTYNAIVEDETVEPLGFRFRLKTEEQGAERAQQLALGTGHLLHSLQDFGNQTRLWMGDLLHILKRAGMSFQHTPFNGQKLARITEQPPTP